MLVHARPLESHAVHDCHIHIDLYRLATVVKQTQSITGEECNAAVDEAGCGLKGGEV
jgi:hypothetical protein